MDSNVEMYKIRLVAKSYRKRQWVEFDGTFSSVAILKSIRILLVIIAYHYYEIWQMDVKTVFLNENIHEEVYMI